MQQQNMNPEAPAGESRKSLIISIVGCICLAAPVLFLENMTVAGIFCTLGLVLLFCGGSLAVTRADIIWNGILLWLGHSVRYCGLFGSELLYMLFVCLIFIPACALLVLAMWLDRRLRKAGHPILSMLAIPLTYAVLSFLTVELNLGYITNIMGYTMCIPVIAMNLSLLGEYGMTFFLLLALMCFAKLFLEPQRKIRLLSGACSLVICAVLLVCGVFLQQQPGEPDYTLNIALATSQEMDFTGENGLFYTTDQQLDMFSAALDAAVTGDAKLLVLNEEYFSWHPEDSPSMLEKISQLVRQAGIPVLAGIEEEHEDALSVNEAVYFDADGEIRCTYIKNNLVPFIEAGNYVNGPEEPALVHAAIDGHSLDLAYVICFDINDEIYLRKISSSARLLIVPSWDWDTTNIEQQRTRIRSAALGLTLVKHSFDGFSFVSCPNGECAESVDLRGRYETVAIVTVPIWED